ncbi:MAG: FKBP-type peptidyl-prolyl cis-trans isomerase [Gemmatimonadetes bacterium]|nr:FKBP-type peptidyl-prolyl cis-trans isomerase [Gemmatimonadota bacterium]
MRVRIFLALAAVCAAAAACESNDPIGPDCIDATSTVQGRSGDTVTTVSGLRYIDLRAGTGLAVGPCSSVAIHYTLYLNGAAVDSLRDPRYGFFVTPGERPARTIEGVAEGVLGLRVGSVRRLIIPPALGYGSTDRIDQQTGRVVIPANSTLVFDLEVLQVQ